MIKLFNRNKVNVNSISIPDFEWNEDKNNRNIRQWINPEQTIALSLNFFDLKPDLPTINDIEKLRNFYRNQVTANNGGLIEVNKLDLKEYNSIRTIFKFPQEPTGMTYLSSITIPFEKYSYVIKVQAPEIGTTGVRDNVVAMKLLNEGKISIGDNGYEDWFNDPYNSEINEGVRMNKSEEKQFDSEFPDHPLSQARELLHQIELGIEFGNELEKINKFEK